MTRFAGLPLKVNTGGEAVGPDCAGAHPPSTSTTEPSAANHLTNTGASITAGGVILEAAERSAMMHPRGGELRVETMT